MTQETRADAEHPFYDAREARKTGLITLNFQQLAHAESLPKLAGPCNPQDSGPFSPLQSKDALWVAHSILNLLLK